MATLATTPSAINLFPAAALSTQTSAPTAAPTRDENIMAHLSLVRTVARRMLRSLPRHLDLEDLVSAGYVGLMDAAEKFQHNLGTSFRSYAEFRIRGAILDSLRELDLGTRNLRRRAREIEAARAILASTLGRPAELSEIAAHLSLDIADVRRTLNELQSATVTSFQSSNDDDEAQDLLETLADTSIKDPLNQCLEGEFRQRLKDAIDELPERERLVLTLSYFEELTLREIGDILSITESRASQLRSSAVRRMRVALNTTASIAR